MAEDPKTWQPVLTDSFHPMRYNEKVAKEILGKDVNKHRAYERAIPMWKWPLWGVAIEDMTKNAPWKRGRVFSDSYHREAPPEFMNVAVALNKERTVMGEGAAIIDYGKDKHFLLMVARGFNRVMVRAIANEDQSADVEKFFWDLSQWVAKNNFYKGQKIDASGKFLDLEDVKEADLILDDDLKRELFRNVKQMVQKYGDYDKYGIPAKRGVIMAGPPGNGKSLSMKVLAKALDCSFIWVTPRHIAESDGFAQIYEFARELAPSVVLLEDADGFGLDRRMAGFNPILGELLNIMDGFVANKGVITILTSNYAEMLDSALTHRPGRFDTKLLIGPPKPEKAFELMNRTLEQRKVSFVGNPGDIKAAAFALAKEKASGAFIVECVNYAMMLAVERGRGGASQLRLDPVDLKDSVARIIAMLQTDSVMDKALKEEGVFKWGGWTQERAATSEE